MAGFDLAGGDDGLRAALDSELLQDGGDMGLDRRFRHAEFVGDLLVEQTTRKHHQHPNLLRRQRRQPRHRRRCLGVGFSREIDIGWCPHFTLQHARHRRPQRLNPERLGDETGSAELHAATDDRRIVVGRHHHDRQARILRPQIHKARKAAHARHAQIEQDQIDLGDAAVEEFAHLLEGAGLGDLGPAEHAIDRFAQRAAKQRMIVGNQQMMGWSFTQRENPGRARQTRMPKHRPLGECYR